MCHQKIQLWQGQGVKELLMNNIAARWNVLDSFICKIESRIDRLSNAVKESKDEIPDPEEIIAAATEQLQQENEQLKKRLYPGKIIAEGNSYYCPDCHEQLSTELIKKKFCPECGKRIVLVRKN